MHFRNTSLYFVKDCLDPTRSDVRKDFRHSALPLDFFEQIFIQQRQKLVKTGTDDETRRAADYAAACATQLHSANLLHVEAVGKALEYCQDLILDLGFRQTPVHLLQDGTAQIDDHVILVPGCQTKPHYQSRVRALLHVLNGAHFAFKIVFSGKHPPKAQSVQTPDEALAMNVYFDEICGRDSQFGKHSRRQLYLEQESGTTSENIEKFMSEPNLITPTRPCQILLVSSLYHLPRLAQALEEYIVQKDVTCVKRIVLVGAENTGPNKVSRDSRYVKQMFYEVFLHILRQHRAPSVPL